MMFQFVEYQFGIESISELAHVVDLATKFLICGTMRAELPYQKVYAVRQKNRRLGLGLMGMHEWLIKRGEKYEVSADLHRWLSVYKGVSDDVSRKFADELSISSSGESCTLQLALLVFLLVLLLA